jgi:hypothetical protein
MPDRILKESISKSETINELSPEQEVFFYRLLVHCDDFGRFDAKPALLRSALFPLRTDSITVEQILSWRNAIADHGLIRIYVASGKEYLEVLTWRQYQRVRADKSKYPEPVDIVYPLPASADKCPQVSSSADIGGQMPPYSNTRTNTRTNTNTVNENENENDNGNEESCSGSSFPINLTADEIAEITRTFEENVCKLTEGVIVELNDVMENHSKQTILDAIKVCAMQNKHSMAYFLGVLKNKGNGSRAAPGKNNQIDPDKFIKGKYGHMVQR